MSYKKWSIKSGDSRYDFDEVEVTGWTINGRQFRAADADRPRADGRFFGIDYVTPGDILIDLIIRAKGKTREERFERAMDLRSEFDTVWNADSVRLTNGATSELVVAGRAMVEGRSRHVDWDDARATFGIIRGSALFVRSGTEFFPVDENGDTPWSSATLMLVPSQLGGIKTPLKGPISTTIGSSRAAPVRVTSTHDVWPIIEIVGPIQSNAQVEVPGRWRLYLNRSLTQYETVRIDTRPGRLATYINGSPAQVLDPRSSMLSECSLKPGDNVVAYSGSSLEGTASVTLQWRNSKGNL